MLKGAIMNKNIVFNKYYRNLRTNVFDRLEPYKLDLGERVSAFALSLANVIAQVEGIFPKELNCLEMSLDTVMYLSHMDV